MINRRTAIAIIAAFVLSIGSSEAASFQIGDFVTYSQASWGGNPATDPAAQLLLAQFDGFYTGGLEVGVIGGAGFSMIFTSAPAALFYLPGTGTPGVLTADLVDPTSTGSGVTGGEVIALQLNVDFSDANYLTGTAGIPFGDLVLTDLAFAEEFNGLTIRQFLAVANSILGGGVNPTTDDELAALLEDVNGAFGGGTPTLWAQNHLVSDSQPVPEPTSLLLFGSGALGVLARMQRRKRQ